jgi:K(+)-stimulated pyrophosphate-energized sodium pump
MVGLVASALGLIFGLIIYNRLKNMPVHRSMLEVSELIYANCSTYLRVPVSCSRLSSTLVFG